MMKLIIKIQSTDRQDSFFQLRYASHGIPDNLTITGFDNREARSGFGFAPSHIRNITHQISPHVRKISDKGMQRKKGKAFSFHPKRENTLFGKFKTDLHPPLPAIGNLHRSALQRYMIITLYSGNSTIAADG